MGQAELSFSSGRAQEVMIIIAHATSALETCSHQFIKDRFSESPIQDFCAGAFPHPQAPCLRSLCPLTSPYCAWPGAPRSLGITFITRDPTLPQFQLLLPPAFSRIVPLIKFIAKSLRILFTFFTCLSLPHNKGLHKDYLLSPYLFVYFSSFPKKNL